MERTSINPYKTFGRGNPSPVQIDTSIAYDNYQRKYMFSHAILRFCTANPDEIQPIGAYSGITIFCSSKPNKI